MSQASPSLPDLGEAVRPVFESVPEPRRPLLVALLERSAARRYRTWAARPELAARAAELRRCAEREEEIAARVEALYPDARHVQAQLLATLPDLDAFGRDLFDPLTLLDQLRVQARGERLGSATWRSLARAELDPARSKALLACAPLEEASAEVLERIVAQHG
jgi:hypothetical protein